MKLPISVILLTHNEEKNIVGCLASCDFAQEIIVIDDQSTDRTVGIAKEFEAVKVFFVHSTEILPHRKILELRKPNVTGFSLLTRTNALLLGWNHLFKMQ